LREKFREQVAVQGLAPEQLHQLMARQTEIRDWAEGNHQFGAGKVRPADAGLLEKSLAIIPKCFLENYTIDCHSKKNVGFLKKQGLLCRLFFSFAQ
jgi:hypothetical protein